MKLVLSFLLSAVKLASISAIPPAVQLGFDLPDSRFKANLIFDAPLLAVDATFVNILNFMNIVARVDFDDHVQPHTYNAPLYGQVEVTTYAPTEARFLLWGVYLAITDMVKFRRFNDVVVKLYWENNFVGQLSLMAKTRLSLPSNAMNIPRSITDNSGQLGLVDIDDKTTQAPGEGQNIRPVQNTTGGDTSKEDLVVNSVNTGNMAISIAPLSSTQVSRNALLSSRFSIDFDFISDAKRLSRNDVFLTFFAAMLHVAKFPAENYLQYFNSMSPTVDLRVHMFDTGTGCMYRQVLTALVYVPKYMMEHPGFGYKETNFNIRLSGVRGCRGSILDSMLSAG